MLEARPRLAGELVFSLFMSLFSAFLLWSAVGISGFASYTSAGSFPMAAAALMLACSVIAVAQAVKMPPPPSHAPLVTQFMKQLLPPTILLFTLALVVYMLTLEWLGFLIGSYLFLVAGMRILGSQRWGLNLLVAAGMLAAIYVVFQTAFSVVLPAGTLWVGVFQ